MTQNTISYLSPKLEALPREEKGGGGVFARDFIRKGELLVVWGGRVVHAEEFNQLPERRRSHSIQIEDALYLVPVAPEEPADLVNHSCDPNAGLSGQIALVAMRNIKLGEEICFDYAMSDASPYDEFDCACGAANCRERVTGNDWKLPELWVRYQGHFSPYIQRRIEKIKIGLPVYKGRF